MKRILALLLALVMTFGLFACTAMPLETEPLETLPVQTEPVETEGIETELLQTEPVQTEPIETEPLQTEPEETEALLDPDGWYYSAEDVALYLVTYGELPSNFITKKRGPGPGLGGRQCPEISGGCGHRRRLIRQPGGHPAQGQRTAVLRMRHRHRWTKQPRCQAHRLLQSRPDLLHRGSL